MSKGSNGGSSKGGSSNSGKGGSGGRPSTGFPGGNWPSTKTGIPSGGNRGNAPSGNKGS